jgi:hypothetical protein
MCNSLGEYLAPEVLSILSLHDDRVWHGLLNIKKFPFNTNRNDNAGNKEHKVTGI